MPPLETAEEGKGEGKKRKDGKGKRKGKGEGFYPAARSLLRLLK